MDLPILLSEIEDAGLTIAIEDGGLRVRPRERLTDRLRGLIRDHKDELIDALSPDTDDPPRRLWLVRHPDGTVISHAFTPPVTLGEVLTLYPGASVKAEVEPTAGTLDDATRTQAERYLDRIGEHDPVARAEYLDHIATDPRLVAQMTRARALAQPECIAC
jgi:hypothetical protein